MTLQGYALQIAVATQVKSVALSKAKAECRQELNPPSLTTVEVS